MLKNIAWAAIGLALPLVCYAADIEQGRLKAQACTACHGANGISISDDIPNLAGQKTDYIVKQLEAFRDQTRRNPLMNVMAAPLSDDDIDNVAAFFNSLSAPGDSAISDTGKALNERKIAFPADYQQTFARYSVVDQADAKRVRHNYVNPTGQQGVDDQGVFPDGTAIVTEIYAAKLDAEGNPVSGDDGHFVADKLLALAVMEKRSGWGEVIPEELRNGNWHYALFTPEQQARDFNHAACLACHKPLDDADYLFSYQALVGSTR